MALQAVGHLTRHGSFSFYRWPDRQGVPNLAKTDDPGAHSGAADFHDET